LIDCLDRWRVGEYDLADLGNKLANLEKERNPRRSAAQNET